MRPTYTAHAERSGAWWAVDVPEIRGVFTQARRLDHVEAMARDAIALMLEVPHDSFDVVVVPELGAGVDALISMATRTRQHAADAEREASESIRRAVAVLLATGLTMRDAGRLLGVSHQRIAQLAPRAHAGTDAPSAPPAAPPRVAASGPG